MDSKAVLRLLELNQNERGMAHFRRLHPGSELKSFGLGLSSLKKLSKGIQRDHDLFMALWEVAIYDSKIMATLICIPHKISMDIIHQHIPDAIAFRLTYSYCNGVIAPSSFCHPLVKTWARHDVAGYRECAFRLLYNQGKDNRDLKDMFFYPYLEQIRTTIHNENNWVKDAMLGCLLSVGKRSVNLNSRVLQLAKDIGRPDIDYGDTACQPLDVITHMTAPALKAKLGIG